MLILECEQGTVFQSGANQFGLQPAGRTVSGLPNHPTIGKQSLLLPAANSIQPTRVSYFPQSINSYFYSTTVSYFLQSINSVQSWSPPHTLSYEEEIAVTVSRFIDFLFLADRICK